MFISKNHIIFMDTLIKDIMRRFNILKEIAGNDCYDKNDKIHLEFHKLSRLEIDQFQKLIDRYLVKSKEYTCEIIRKQLIYSGYIDFFVDYLLDIENKHPDKQNEKINDSLEDSNTNEDFFDLSEKSDTDEQNNDNSEKDDNSKNNDNSEQDDNSEKDDDNMEDNDNIEKDNNLKQFDDMFEIRPNQKKAIDETIKQDFKSGVHNQIMGAGKSYIILKLIDEHFKAYQDNKVYLLLCDRQEILKKMFFNDDCQIDRKKIIKWKKAGIIDLTKFDILEYIYHKKKI